MSIISKILRIKYEVGELWTHLWSEFVTSTNKLIFEPLDIRRSAKVSRGDFNYSILLQYRNGWLTKYSNSLDETIRVLLQNKERKKLFANLIGKFKYVSREASDTLIDEIIRYIEHVWQCNPKETVIMSITKTENQHPDGANVLIYQLQKKMIAWDTSRFIASFYYSSNRVRKARNIILCDDFIGSGSTIEKRVIKIRENLKPNQRLYVISIAGMEMAKINVLNNLPVEYFAPIWLKQGINQEEETDVKTMLDMESVLAPKYKDYKLETMTLGYGKSGGLYFNEEYRIPNNVYPIFWWGKLKDGSDFKSIFLRS